MTLKQKKIGILGTGNVGQALGTGFLSLGCQVKLGSRDAKHPQAMAWAEKQGRNASVGTFAEAAAFGELLVLATMWSGTENVVRLAGPDKAAGKVQTRSAD